MLMTLFSARESTDSPWLDLAIEIHTMSALDTPNQPLIRSKELRVYMVFINIFRNLTNIMRLAGGS